MDKNQSDVTDKIRHSIRERLKKMNTFVDDELPEYIMILIANKRSKHHMEKDLSLFLGNQTAEFTNWLWDLVNAFKAGGKTKSSKSNLILDAQNIDEDDVLSYDPTEQGESLCLEDSTESPVIQENILKAPEKSDDSKISLSENEISENQYLLLSAADKPMPKTIMKRKTIENPCLLLSATEKPMPKTIKNPYLLISATDKSMPKTIIKREKEDIDTAKVELLKTMSSGQTVQKSAKVYPMQRIKPVSNTAVAKPNASAKSAEISKAEYSGVASVVCFTQKKFCGAAAALQANKLLLRAVNDATKSVLSGKDIKDYYKPTPIKELAESKKINEEVKESVHNEINIVESSINEQNNELDKCEMHEPNIISSQISDNLTSRHVVALNPIEVDVLDEPKIAESISPPLVQTEEENSVTPHFIVTLDGVKFSSLKRKRSIISEEEPMDIDEEEENFSDEAIEQSSEKKIKIAERCKYWPVCKNNVECAYHHPTVPCKSFPNCKFGDKCLYIHPNCKFDALCSKKDCPFTHCSIRKYPPAPVAVVKPQKVQKSKIVCKYYPRCTAKACPFIHPKLCRFGTQCHAPRCPFGHFQIPNRNQLKWKAM